MLIVFKYDSPSSISINEILILNNYKELDNKINIVKLEKWKKKMKKALKTPQGLKTVMAIMAEEEKLSRIYCCPSVQYQSNTFYF